MDPFELRLDNLFLRGYRRAAWMLCAFFAGLALFRLAWMSSPARALLVAEASVLALGFGAVAVATPWVRPERTRVEAVGMALVLAGVANGAALHLLLRDDWQTTSFMITALAGGLAFRRTLPFLAAQALNLGTWILCVLIHRPAPLVHWSFAMASALVVAWAFHRFLQALFGQILHLHSRDRELLGEREKLIGELRLALDSVKTLHGLIPICAQCKKIRDDQGFWQSVEHYMATHTEADFTHSLCPACIEAARKEFFKT